MEKILLIVVGLLFLLSTELPLLCPKAGRRTWVMSKPRCWKRPALTKGSLWLCPTSSQVTGTADQTWSLH